MNYQSPEDILAVGLFEPANDGAGPREFVALEGEAVAPQGRTNENVLLLAE